MKDTLVILVFAAVIFLGVVASVIWLSDLLTKEDKLAYREACHTLGGEVKIIGYANKITVCLSKDGRILLQGDN